MKSRLPQGMGGGAQNMQGLLKQAQKMQEMIGETKARLESEEYNLTAGGGAVSITINGKKEIKSLNIKPEIIDPDDAEMLQDVIIAAVNEAIRLVEDTSNAEMAKISGGMGNMGLL